MTGFARPLQRIDGDAPQVFGAIDEVRMRELFEVNEEIRRRERAFSSDGCGDRVRRKQGHWVRRSGARGERKSPSVSS